MSQPDTDYFKRVDAHLALANDDSGRAPGPDVANSLGFAAARFNCWLLANQYGSPDNMKAQRDTAIAMLMDHYRHQLEHNYDDFANNYANYFEPDVKTGPAL